MVVSGGVSRIAVVQSLPFGVGDGVECFASAFSVAFGTRCYLGLVLVPFVLMSPSDALTRYYWIAEYAAEGFIRCGSRWSVFAKLLGHHGIEMSFGRYFAVQAVTCALILLVLLS
jgi:hypothetical protein